jgi:uncharacterized protein (UPF0264 family)
VTGRLSAPGIPQLWLRQQYCSAVSDYENAPGTAFLDAVDLYLADAEFHKIGPLLRRARDEVEMLTSLAVARAAKRESWQEIGAALGVTRQAARKKYGPS